MPATRATAIKPEQFATFGELLKFLRRRAGLSQRELAIAVGYSTSQISRLEQNERPPDVASLAARFVPALQLEPDWAAGLMELAAVSRAAGQRSEIDRVDAAPTPTNNLPRQLTSFVGREPEIAHARRLLRSSALVTLTGPGGAGKTRLSLEIATQVLHEYPDGVWLVEFAPLADAALVPQAIASVLGVPEMAGRPVLETLKSYLRTRTALIVLDNCEHLITACAHVAETLLAVCSNLRVLATSREALDLAGEMTLAVPPLSSPDERQPVPVDALTTYEAVRLFVDRAVTALPDFALTPANAPAVAHVCRQMDGMPLAIEMAAARVKLLRVEQIAERLNDRFQLLTAGRRTALPRHQSLAAVIDWSYELLSEPERSLLRRLAVFAGGWTMEAAEQVCGDEPGKIGSTAVLDLLGGLVNKSLVVTERQASQEARYHCLETIRQYALIRLTASGEEEATRRQHAHYYRSLAETVEPLLFTADEQRWLDRLQVDLDNFRAAMAWSQKTNGDPKEGLRLGNALYEFWWVRGKAVEGLAWLEAGLSLAVAVVEPVRVKAFLSAGRLSQASGDFARTAQHLKDCERMSRTIGDQWCLAWALSGLGLLAWNRRDDDTAQALLAESLALFRQLGDKLGIASQLNSLGNVARGRGDFNAAQAQYAESLRLFQQLGYLAGVADVVMDLGHLARAQGDGVQAADFYDQALALGRQLDNKLLILEPLIGLARLAHNRGDDVQAKTLLVEAMVIVRDIAFNVMGGYCLAGLGGVAAAQRQPELGAKLLSAGAAWLNAVQKRMTVSIQAEFDSDVAAAREQLDEAAFAAAWAEGQAMTTEQAIELALRT